MILSDHVKVKTKKETYDILVGQVQAHRTEGKKRKR